MVHSISSMDYLKVDPTNFIHFEFASDVKTISIQQQYTATQSAEETSFETIYEIKLHNPTLRELLIFNSFYVCSTQSEILTLVQLQPKPMLFYKSILEFDSSNMVSILSFDSRSMKVLLDESNEEYFDEKYPLFYRNKLKKLDNKGKNFYRSAIDNALRNNQISAVTSIIEYIVKYQNNFVSSFLFQRNFFDLIEKGISVSSLLNSNIFCFSFDFDEWPSIHFDHDKYLKPYNGSVFELRDSYHSVFDEAHFQIPNKDLELMDNKRVAKVQYTINMLPSLGEYVVMNADGSKTLVNENQLLMAHCIDSDELSIFESDNFGQLIQFKWEQFAFFIHTFGFVMHLFYVFIMVIYIYNIYIENNHQQKDFYSRILILAVVYPAWYDTAQLWNSGWRVYFSELQNYSDLIYIYGSILNVILQNISSSGGDNPNSVSFSFFNKLLMTIILSQQVIKTFFFLKTVNSISYIVTMLTTVIYDLRIFLMVYGILLFFASLIFAVLGLNNRVVNDGLLDSYKAL